MKVFVINGPNLNLLGTREPGVYGHETLANVETRCRAVASDLGIDVEFFQSNFEGQLVEWIQEAAGIADAIIVNAAAYTHTSVAVHDALKSFGGYKIELHISHPHLRESFRRVSFVSPVVNAVIAGLGTDGYIYAIEMLPEAFAADRQPG